MGALSHFCRFPYTKVNTHIHPCSHTNHYMQNTTKSPYAPSPLPSTHHHTYDISNLQTPNPKSLSPPETQSSPPSSSQTPAPFQAQLASPVSSVHHYDETPHVVCIGCRRSMRRQIERGRRTNTRHTSAHCMRWNHCSRVYIHHRATAYVYSPPHVFCPRYQDSRASTGTIDHRSRAFVRMGREGVGITISISIRRIKGTFGEGAVGVASPSGEKPGVAFIHSELQVEAFFPGSRPPSLHVERNEEHVDAKQELSPDNVDFYSRLHFALTSFFVGQLYVRD